MIEKQTDVTLPHGLEQNIKMELLGMIHNAENPFDIILHVAKYLEKVSAEAGYADHVRADLRAIYGLALLDKKLLTDEKKDVEERLARIQQAYDTADFTEEERHRIRFAINLHKKNIERLQERIHEAEVNGTSMYKE
ncbi:MAG: hypothetical protein IJS96_01575 [Schwartzia sp.]|nr:hypothetical protein [Schwartzia sp. (in: firmicutes)]